jgi:Condensation domain
VVLRQSHSLTVPFAGDRAGRYPLTWGQKDVYRAHQRYSPRAAFFNLRSAVPLPAGIDLPGVAAVVGRTVGRYESLRTTYPVDGALGRCQQVLCAGSLPLRVFDVPRAAFRPDDELEHFGAEFDHDRELPFRCGVVREDGRPAWLVLEISHLSVDREGCRLLEAELARALGGAGEPAEAVHQPVEQMVEESSDRGRNTTARSTEHLVRLLDRYPVPVFAARRPAEPVAVRRPRVLMASPALGAAVNVLARRHRSTTSSVYTTYLALLVGALSGRGTCLFSTVSANRWVSGGRGCVGTLNQYALIAVDLDDGDFATVLRRTQAACFQGFGNASYDIDDLATSGHLVALDRVDCVINITQRSTVPRPPQAPVGDPRDLRGLTTVTELAPLGESPEGIVRSVQLSVSGGAERPELSLSVDRWALPTVDPTAVLRALEAAVVDEAEAHDPTTPGVGRLALSALREALDAGAPDTVAHR